MDAVVRKTAAGTEIHFDLHLRHPVAEVWASLTESDKLADWLATGSIEARAGGRVRLQFGKGRVLESDVLEAQAPSTLAYRWVEETGGVGTVRWTLTDEGLGTHLALIHTISATADPREYAAGWHMHFELLTAALDDLPANWSNERWTALREYYEKKLGT